MFILLPHLTSKFTTCHFPANFLYFSLGHPIVLTSSLPHNHVSLPPHSLAASSHHLPHTLTSPHGSVMRPPIQSVLFSCGPPRASIKRALLQRVSSGSPGRARGRSEGSGRRLSPAGRPATTANYDQSRPSAAARDGNGGQGDARCIGRRCKSGDLSRRQPGVPFLGVRALMFVSKYFYGLFCFVKVDKTLFKWIRVMKTM